ncbi:DivIVA domain-containing protein [Actinocorallia longicatena]|uniref:DivIVA domain-containing protein n=1 Tax=Actinocorallia longicatena TaxID=111803 RepID=A0ABP6PYS9_9ACTN
MARFPVVMRGYFGEEVDALIVRIEATLGRTEDEVPEVTAAEVREARFAAVVRGYDRHAVDEALTEYIRELEAFERGDAEPYVETVRGQVPWLIRWIEDAEFSVTRMRAGYAEKDVDDFLDRVVGGLRGEAPPVSGHDARTCVFRSAFLAPGYSEPEVDRFLDQLAAALDHLTA